MKEIIAIGKNIEKAIENGLSQIGAKFEDVDIEILSEGGFFTKAKVKITLNDGSEETPSEPKIITQPKDAKKEEMKEDVEGITISLKKANKEEKVVTVKEAKEVKERKEKRENAKPNKQITTTDSVGTFLQTLLENAEVNCEVKKEEDDQYIRLSITGDNLSSVIGNKGECLAAIQYITSLVKNESEKNKRVIVDAGNYKKDREGKVKELTLSIIRKVEETGRWEKLKPMSAYERRIVHEILGQNESVRGESRGEEPNRYITIYPNKQ